MSIPGSGSPLLFSADAAAAGGYEIERSLRFNSADSAFLSRTPSTAGNRKTWTWSGWVKRGFASTYVCLFGTATYGVIQIRSGAGVNDDIDIFFANTTSGRLISNAYLRDYSAWYHIVFALDTTQSTPSDRAKLYINGIEQTFASATYPAQNYESGFNNNEAQYIGATNNSGLFRYFDGYLADIHFIDGQALDPTDFGEFDATTGAWNPIAYTGTYGTNGFHLDFADNSNNTASTLGKDTSPNGNNWTPNNLRVTNQAAGTDYTSGLSTSGGAASGYPYSNVFDSDTSNFFLTSGATTGTTWTFTPPTAISASTLVIRVSQGARYRVNGGSWTTYSGGGSGELTLTSSITGGSITSIQGESLGNYEIGLWYIVVNGNTLIQTNADTTDSLRDSPTNGDTADDTGAGGEVPGNYATLNPLAESGGNRINAVNGNLDADGLSYGYWGNILSTIAVSSGKWYAEFTVATAGLGVAVGILDVNPLPSTYSNDDQYMGRFAKGYGYRSDSGNKVNNNSATSYGATFTNGDVIGVALDLDAGTLVFYKNNTSQGTAFSSLSGTFAFAVATVDSVSLVNCNFGQRAFAYSAPSGYKALCTANLDDPTIADGSTAMDVALYTGNGSTNTITGLGFSPDFVWIKPRSAAYDHIAFDTVRGTLKALFPNLNNAENSNFTGTLTAFNSDGYTIGSQAQINQSGVTFASWCWDAGSSTVSNTDGSVTSSVRANANAGFSIVTYTGGSGEISVGHGLGVAPSFIICRPINNSSPWATYHSSIGKDGGLNFSTSAAFSISNYWGTSGVTSTIFGAQNGNINNNGSSYNHVAYCFAPVEGYSAFGSYTGNGSSTSPPFVYTGFRVKWLMLKCTSTGGSNWILHDVARKGYNAQGPRLFPNLSDAESTPAYDMVDLYSNGFSPIRTVLDYNQNGDTYIYAAFAEHPQKYARAR